MAKTEKEEEEGSGGGEGNEEGSCTLPYFSAYSPGEREVMAEVIEEVFLLFDLGRQPALSFLFEYYSSTTIILKILNDAVKKKKRKQRRK